VIMQYFIVHYNVAVVN